MKGSWPLAFKITYHPSYLLYRNYQWWNTIAHQWAWTTRSARRTMGSVSWYWLCLYYLVFEHLHLTNVRLPLWMKFLCSCVHSAHLSETMVLGMNACCSFACSDICAESMAPFKRQSCSAREHLVQVLSGCLSLDLLEFCYSVYLIS